MGEWVVGLGYKGQLATWLVASFLLHFFAAQLAWQYRYPGRDDSLGRFIDRVRDRPLVPWLEEVVRLVYYLGIPFMAAINGLLRADLLGIKGTDWIAGQGIQGFLWEDWARGLGLATTAVLATWGAWLIGRSISRRAGLIAATPGLSGPAWRRLLGVLYDQIHWAFYRSGPMLWLDDVYWGVFVGLALVLLETALNSAFWWALKSPETAGGPLTRLGMAWISALVFLGTQNLWLTAATHLALVGLLNRQAPDAYFYSDDLTFEQ